MRRAQVAVVAGLLALGMYPSQPVWGQNQEMEDRQRESEARRDALERQIADQQREAESRREAAERQQQDQQRQQAERQREAESRREAAERQRQDQERQQAERQREDARRDALERQRQQADQQRETDARREAADRQRQEQERQQAERRREDARREDLERQRQQADEREAEARRVNAQRLQQEQRENEARRAAERMRQDREDEARRTVEAERLRRSQETEQRRDEDRRQELQILRQVQRQQDQRQGQPLPRTAPPPTRAPEVTRPSEIRPVPPAEGGQNSPIIVVRPRAPQGANPPARRDDGPAESLYIGAPRNPGAPDLRARRPAYNPPPSTAVEGKTPDGGLRLNPTGSEAIRRQLNAARQELRGINARPLPAGRITVRGNGGLLLNTDAASYDLRANGRIAGIRANGRDAQFGPDGRVRSLRTPNLDIRRDHRGKRIIIGRRPDKSRVVVTGPRRGYLERFFRWKNQDYIHRTWWGGGAAYSWCFGQYRYHGLFLPYYIPGYYYSRAFYGWASSPWGMRATFSWPWLTESWYRGYVRYFTPALYYADAYTWLADYILARTMEAGSLEEGDNAEPSPLYEWGGADDLLYAEYDTPITEDLRADVALEVRHHLDAERELAEGNYDPERVGLPAFLKPNRVLVVL